MRLKGMMNQGLLKFFMTGTKSIFTSPPAGKAIPRPSVVKFMKFTPPEEQATCLNQFFFYGGF
jgi:hypothetical protein